MKFEYRDVFKPDGKINSALVKENRWLYYLAITNNVFVNYERVKCMSDVTGNETLEYVFRTLEILDEDRGLPREDEEIIRKVLQWSEVSKGGTDAKRKEWIQKGYPIDIHNIASAEIYLEESNDSVETARIVYIMIKTHGIIGQNIRGEVGYGSNYPLIELISSLMPKSNLDDPCNESVKQRFRNMLYVLNKCIIGAVSMDLWNNIKGLVRDCIRDICSCKIITFDSQWRMERLLPRFAGVERDVRNMFKDRIFPYFELWYFASALESFDVPQIVSLMKLILSSPGIQKATHMNFKPIADLLYYDYENSRHINVYRQRVIEKFLKDGGNEHISLDIKMMNGTAMVGFEFSPACEKLTDFCVEAERTGLLTYEKSIRTLFDMFGFRRDEYDRLNNEAKYLSTMNDCADSKKSLPDYIGKGMTIVDVGSGGGVMLDILEKKFPDRAIIGTDISTNVIMELEKRKHEENHTWTTKVHNFVESKLTNKADTIIFSSILHEIFSYTDGENGRFDIESVKKALRNAKDSLVKGGRIIIRDGIKTEISASANRGDDGKDSSQTQRNNATLTIGLKAEDGLKYFKMFLTDFAGLKEVSRYYNQECIDGIPTVTADVNLIREFMYTYTWGTESYGHEIQEQFGYMTLSEFKHFFTEELGMKIVVAREFFEDGYYEHLHDKIVLDKEEYPCSNCIIVAEYI